MAFQVVPDCASVELRLTQNGKNTEMTFYQTNSSVIDEDALEILAGIYADWYDELARTEMPATTIGREVYARSLEVEFAAQYTDVSILGSPGTGASTPLPNNVSLAIKRVSGLTGRSSRGRIYWPGLEVGALDANENFVAASFVNAILSDMASLHSELITAGWTPVIVSRYANHVKRATGLTFPISGWAVSDRRIDSRRSRLPD